MQERCKRGHCSGVHIDSRDESLLVLNLSARSAETTLLTVIGCPIASFAAIQPLLTAVCEVLRRIATGALQSSVFLNPFKPAGVEDKIFGNQ